MFKVKIAKCGNTSVLKSCGNCCQPFEVVLPCFHCLCDCSDTTKRVSFCLWLQSGTPRVLVGSLLFSLDLPVRALPSVQESRSAFAFLTAASYSITWTYHSLSSHSATGGSSDCFGFLCCYKQCRVEDKFLFLLTRGFISVGRVLRSSMCESEVRFMF